jgi:hypothetical protein
MKRLLSIELQKFGWIKPVEWLYATLFCYLLSFSTSIKFEIGAIKLHLAEMEF